MKKLFKKQFALTDKGAHDLIKACSASFFVYLATMLPVILLMFLFDDILEHHPMQTWFYIGFALATLVILYGCLHVEYNTLYNTTYKESANLRIEIAHTISKLPLSYFSRHDVSDLSQTIMADVAAIEHAMSAAIAKAIAFLAYFVVIAILLIAANVRLGLAVVIPVLLGLFFILLSKRIQLRGNKEHYDVLRENAEHFQEAIELQQEIKSYGQSETVKKELYADVEHGEKVHLKAEFIAVTPLMISGLIVQAALPIVILSATALFATGAISIVYLIGYILVAIKVKEAVDGVNANLTELLYIDSMIKRIKEIRETKIQKGKDVAIPSFDIEVKDVGFSYHVDTPVLHRVSFCAKQNEVTALVGMSGCGKTTILRLLSRLYDYDKGHIYIGGVEIKDISTAALFKQISIVFQDVTLFNTSIMDNIRLGKEAASDEEVRHAAKLAYCDEFVNKLPNGYETTIGEDGATLSGGERQRISIARAFLKDAPIIILDEIAASLDVENEKRIQDSLHRLMENKTVIIISHRMKSIENVDHIVVLDKGCVDAQGTHEEVMKHSSIYRDLVENARLAQAFTY